jgi:hypothetical protein
MNIQIKNTNIFPYIDGKQEIIGIGGDHQNMIETSYKGGDRKCDIYYENNEVIKWTEEEKFNIYRYKIKLDIEQKAMEYTARIDYRVNYYRDKDNLTPIQQQDYEEKKNQSIDAKEYIHTKILNIDAATNKDDVLKEYNEFLEKYNKKRQELENIL